MRQKLILTTTSLHNVVISNSSDVIYYEIVTPKWERSLTKISRLDPNTRQFDLIGELQNEDDKPVAMRLYGGSFRSTVDFLKDEPDRARIWNTSVRPDEIVVREKGGDEQEEHRPPPPSEKALTEELGPFKAESSYAAAKITTTGPNSSKREAQSQDGEDRRSETDQAVGKRHRKHNWCETASFNGKDGRKYTWRGDQKHLELLREDMPGYPVATYHRQKRYLYVLRMSQHPYLEVDSAAMDTLDSLIQRRRRDGKK